MTPTFTQGPWGLSKAEYQSLFRVADQLRSGNIFHFKTPDDINYNVMYSVTTRGTTPIIFDMRVVGYQFPCGFVTGISGLVAREMSVDPHWYSILTEEIKHPVVDLYRRRSQHYTPGMAADAIDNFLLHGEPRWRTGI